MDAFYASVEQRDFPEYRGKPIVVGGSPEGRGGVVATASYEARKFGIRSAMPSKTALRLCPQVIFIYPRFQVYKEVSEQIRAILHRYTDIIEPLSLDEAYLDVTQDKQHIGYAIDIAKLIKQSIKEELLLTASAGVSINKFVAKIASDMHKPDGLTFIGPSHIEAFMEKLPVDKFHGVGKVTAAKMQGMGLHTGADIKKFTEEELVKHFGKPGKFYYQIVRGIDNREVQPYREIKSISVEDTFQTDLFEKDSMLPELQILSEKLSIRLQKNSLKARTITIKFKFNDFTIITRSQSNAELINDAKTIFHLIKEMLMRTMLNEKGVRLLGIGASNFDLPSKHELPENGKQLSLF